MTKAMRVVLGVRAVKDRRAVFDSYAAFQENYARHREKMAGLGHTGEKDEVAADRIGLWAVAAAGYDPEALVRIFDRLAGTKMEAGLGRLRRRLYRRMRAGCPCRTNKSDRKV